MIGRIIGNYQVTGELARGGMGAVFRGQHLHLPREVVIKSVLLAPFSPSAQIHLKARFRREAYIQSQLDHPRIVRVYEFFTAEDNYFLVMEYVPGMSLRDLLARQGVPQPAQAAYLFKQALNALEYAHGFNYVDESDIHHTGVIHRDIKPANLLLDTKGRLKITDFGIAKVLGDQAGSTMMPSGIHPGTVEYMSPEQIRGAEIDRRSDIYSLGVTFYEMLTGRLPFERASSGSDWEIRKGHIELEPPPILERRPDLPPSLAAIVMRTLRKSPGDRYQSATEMIEALRYYELQQAGNGWARVANGKNTALIVATNPDSEMPRPARPSLASIETATTLALEAVNREPGWEPTHAATTVINMTQAPAAPPSGALFGMPPPWLLTRRWRMAAAGLAVVSALMGVYWISQRPGRPERTAVTSRTEAATPVPTATPRPAPKGKLPVPPNPAGGEVTAFKQARVFERQERYGEAIKVFEEYLAGNPAAPDSGAVMMRLGQLKTVQGNLVSADAAMNAGNYQLAARQYGEALRLQPGSQRAKDGLTQALDNMPDLPLRPANRRPRLPAQDPAGNPEVPGPPVETGTPPPPRPFGGLRKVPKTAPEIPESETKPETKLEPKPEAKPEPKP
jgi:serine/threonine protein kinase